MELRRAIAMERIRRGREALAYPIDVEGLRFKVRVILARDCVERLKIVTWSEGLWTQKRPS